MMGNIILPCDSSEVSDGYHTFAELYNHRCLLWMNLLIAHKDKAFKTHLDDEGSKMEGWFIAGMNTPYGQITYHLPEGLWQFLDIPEVDCNADYDGHSSSDTLEILLKLVKNDPLSDESK